MRRLSHERLDVYTKATQFLAEATRVVDLAPRGNSALVDQLRRASISIVLNIAEAAGRTSKRDSARHFAIARGSALECAGALDAMRITRLIDTAEVATGKDLLVDIVSMLTKLAVYPREAASK